MSNQKSQYFYQQEEQDSEEFELSGTELHRVLEESRKFTIKFIEELGEKALTPISQLILSQCNGQVRPLQSPKVILEIVDKRIAKMIRNKKIKKNWNVEDIVLLLWTISKHMEVNFIESPQDLLNKDWQIVSKIIPGSTPKGCMFKFISLKKVKLSVFNWSKEEEEMLRQLVGKFTQNKWKQISEYLYENNPSRKVFRTSKQCRQHWNCYLDPRLRKGPWTSDQDYKLLANVKENKGQRKWSAIKHLFGGRTENALKNRQRKLSQQNSTDSDLIKDYLRTKATPKSSKTEQKNSISVSLHVEERQEIFEEALEPEKRQQKQPNSFYKDGPSASRTRTTKQQTICIKSAKSSFKISEAYEQKMANDDIMQREISMGNMLLMNMRSASQIYPNDMGFYTAAYKPFYHS